MKALQAIVLILVILILLPIAASCAGISLLAIGAGSAVNEVLTIEPAPTGEPEPLPARRTTPRPVPTVDPRIRPAEDAALVRFDDARARELAECEAAAGDDVEEIDRCIEVDNRREDERMFMIDCFDYVAKTLADVIRCEADHAIRS